MNRYTILLLYFCLFSTLSLYGQSFFGIHAGLPSGKFSGDSPSEFNYASKLTFAAGVFYDLQIKKDVYLSLGSAYVNGSSKLQYPKEIDDELVYEDSIFIDFQMVSVPLMMKIISDNKRFQFNGGLEMILPYKLMTDNTVEENDLIGSINKFNLNIQFGVGYRIPVKRNVLLVNLNYSQGMTNLANNLDDPDSLLPRIRYTSFRLSVGWLFAVGKDKKVNNSDN